jgi:hypothetical protein
MKRFTLALFLIILCAVSSRGEDAGFSFLRLPLAARSTALGEAVAATADDPSGILYNPACLALIKSRQAYAGYIRYVADIQAGNLAYIHPYDPKVTFSAGLSYLNSGSIKETTMDMPTGTGQEFTYASSCLYLGYGRIITPQLYAGGLVKGIYDKVQAYSASAAALDLGVIYEIDMEQIFRGVFKITEVRNYGTSLTAGLAVQNLGVATKAFVDKKERLPLVVRTGLAYRPFMKKITLAWGLSKALDADLKNQFGMEYIVQDIVALRLGYNGGMADIKTGSDTDDFAGLTGGLGVCYRKYSINFAYTPLSGLGNPLRVDIGAEF